MASAFAVGMVQPTKLTFNVVVSGSTHQYLDLAALLSRANKRLYRSGMVYHAQISTTPSTPAGIANNLSVLDNSWPIHSAWRQAHKAWRQSTQHERDAGIKAGRWNDFRVRYEQAHLLNGTNTYPVSSFPGDAEWPYTQAPAVDGGATRSFTMLDGTGPQSWGVLEEYDNMRDQDTDTPAAAGTSVPFNGLVAELNNAQSDQIQEEGDLPPYSAANLEDFCGDTLFQIVGPLSSPGTPGSLVTTGMIPIPLGLVKLEVEATYGLEIRFKAGKYKGVHAEAI
jgi:hypothetical protein